MFYGQAGRAETSDEHAVHVVDPELLVFRGAEMSCFRLKAFPAWHAMDVTVWRTFFVFILWTDVGFELPLLVFVLPAASFGAPWFKKRFAQAD
ncbi:hypothetical protein [uncultured Mailhella sp.]|uniref:hypothetical protein n=1 Tax=uncultured Mailhella sp. TaxID=1981031 RepID=UPI0025DA5ECA|nr:hypothetical protein [uncultured Mailhella sp.]